jgi:16S rRNA (guanine527-N7)-methyltransferase
MAHDYGRLLRASRDALAPAIDDARLELLAKWVERVDETNQRIDLTAARTPEELVDLLVADALVLSTLLSERARIVDVGTGAGAPGLGLAIIREDLDMTLVEPLDKRVAFLRGAIGSVLAGRANLPRVIRGRGEAVKERFDVAVSRATLPPPEWLALGRKLAPAGDVWVLLAKAEPPEPSPARVVDYVWPLTGAARTMVLYRAQQEKPS